MKKTTKKIIATILIILILFTPNASIVNATDENAESETPITVESAKAQIANWALSFKASEGSKWVYNNNDSTRDRARAATYNGGYPQSSYVYDCVGCVSYIIHMSIGITYSGAESGISGFVTPQSNVRDTRHFTLHTISESSRPTAGDVLIASKGVNGSTHNHVAIYCGNDTIVDIIRTNDTTIRTVTSNWEENGSSGCIFSKYATLTSVDGASFTPIEGGAILPTPGNNDNNGGGSNGNTGEIIPVVDLDEVADKFKYQGMPTDINYSQEDANVFKWLFDNVDGFMDYATGIMASIVRMPIVGLTSIVERTISQQLQNANG